MAKTKKQHTKEEAQTQNASKVTEWLYNLAVEKATHDLAFRERLARKFGYMLPEVFEAERQKAEVAERLKAEAERLKTIQKLNKKGWTDMEIAEFMELDLKTIQTYIAATEDA